jgi:hypothetical protein
MSERMSDERLGELQAWRSANTRLATPLDDMLDLLNSIEAEREYATGLERAAEDLERRLACLKLAPPLVMPPEGSTRTIRRSQMTDTCEGCIYHERWNTLLGQLSVDNCCLLPGQKVERQRRSGEYSPSYPCRCKEFEEADYDE